MDISIRVVMLSAEVSNSIKQMENLFRLAVGANVPLSSGLERLAIQLRVSHPAGGVSRMRGSGSYDKATGTFFASAPIDYEAWAKEDWGRRVQVYADATALAVKAIFKTRISERNRTALLNHIRSAADELSDNPPNDVAKTLPIELIYVAGDLSPPSVVYDRSAIRALPAGRVVVVPPAEAASYAGMACSKADEFPKMFKLHRRADSGLEYREACPTADGIIEHKGHCGDYGIAFRHATRDVKEQHRLLARLRDAAKAEGFRHIPQSRLAAPILECSISGFSSTEDIDRRHALEALLDEHLGWMGLGHCDGGASGSDTMEVFCLVIDRAIAKEALAPVLATSRFNDVKFRLQPTT